ncbi:MAG: DsrE/DsrF/TusD sulfur relay family protein [Hyphomonadaceae bacterium]
MRLLLILNGPPYGDEKAYNALRLAHALVKADAAAEIVVFLMADAVACAKAGQKTPEGYYNLERMLKRVLAAQGRVLLCGTCVDARGIGDVEIVAGAKRSTMDELAQETLSADKVLVF